MKESAPAPWSVGVVVPAQNEESTIERCIESIRAAACAGAVGGRLWIVVVADACADATASRARRALGTSGEVIECTARSPGVARKIGAAAVLAHFAACNPERLWLANTDADTHVPADWLILHLEWANEGVSAVAGIVQLEPGAAERRSVTQLFRATYELASDGTHEHVHGANFGVRADAYLDVGGWSHVRLAEDHCLWRRLRAAGWSLRSSARSVVVTSARLYGRAAGGFADTLRARLDAACG
jgi:cellulose synthase/poly-beta-1,6-N-acetylglucosamine synthase-like glycosyltransferase